MNIRSSNVARRRGRILNVASIVGYQPGGPGMAVYYATKAYVLSFPKGLAFELAGTGVSVTALCPGRFRFRGRGGSEPNLSLSMGAASAARCGGKGWIPRE
jgi:short-subunit dehydrogenase